jgi:hypothetical protein
MWWRMRPNLLSGEASLSQHPSDPPRTRATRLWRMGPTGYVQLEDTQKHESLRCSSASQPNNITRRAPVGVGASARAAAAKAAKKAVEVSRKSPTVQRRASAHSPNQQRFSRTRSAKRANRLAHDLPQQPPTRVVRRRLMGTGPQQSAPRSLEHAVMRARKPWAAAQCTSRTSIVHVVASILSPPPSARASSR